MTKKSFSLEVELMDAFDETVSAAMNNKGALHIEIIPLKKIEFDPGNPRDLALDIVDVQNADFDANDPLAERKKDEKEALEGLAKSIVNDGLINPILVYEKGDKYRLVAGERRTLASLMAGKEDIQAKILPSKPDALKISILQWVENIERADLCLWDKVRNLEQIIEAYAVSKDKKKEEVSAAEISQLLNCSTQHAYNYNALLLSTSNLKSEIKNGTIKNIEKAALIARAPIGIQNSLMKLCVEGATLAQLKKASSNLLNTQVMEAKYSKMPVKGIRLGTTKKTTVAKIIFESVTKNEKFFHIKEKIGEIAWDNHSSIKRAFKTMLKLLENGEEV